MTNFDPFDVHGMIVRNDCLKWPFAETLKWSFAEMLIDCYFWDGFSMIFAEVACVNNLMMILDWNVDDWCFFLKKLDEMNVYESQSTVPNDVKKWSNKCDATIKLWAGKLLIWCQKCCTWCRCYQMHWRLNVMSELLHSTVKRSNARWSLFVDEVVKTVFDVDVIKCTDDCLCQNVALHQTSSRSNKRQLMFEFLHLIATKSNALTELFDCQTAAFVRETIKCTLTVVCCESSLQSADCNVICDEMSKILHSMLKSSNALTIVCWRRRNIWCLLMLQTDWLAAKQTVDCSIEMLTRCIWSIFFADLTTEFDKTRCWLV